MRIFGKKIFEHEKTDETLNQETQPTYPNTNDNIDQYFQEQDDLSKTTQTTPYQTMQTPNFFTTEPTINQQPQPTFPTPKPTTQRNENITKPELELILSKLDTIKANLETINQRIIHLEKQVKNQQENEKNKLW